MNWMIVFCWLKLCLICHSLIPSKHSSFQTNRREALKITKTIFVGSVISSSYAIKTEASLPKQSIQQPLIKTQQTNSEWKGTSLELLSPSGAITYLNTNDANSFPMGRWPDPALRIPSLPTPSNLFGTPTLQTIAKALRQTSLSNNAVGLAAQQCGIQMSLVYLDTSNNHKNKNKGDIDSGMYLVNPRFISRSPESQMKVWTEQCLVLPPDFQATVLRDAQVIVEAEDLSGNTFRVSFRGELARAIQHECDHDRGILITDHVGVEELRDDEMRLIENKGHSERQVKAFDRFLGLSCTSNDYSSLYAEHIPESEINYLRWAVPKANAVENEKQVVCDEDCRKRIENRRALLNQSRSTRSRQEVFELSRQRALLYNTTYQGSSCLDNLPCY